MNGWPVPQVKLVNYRQLLAGEPITRVTLQSSTQEGGSGGFHSACSGKPWLATPWLSPSWRLSCFQSAVIKTHLVPAKICKQLLHDPSPIF